MRPLPGIAAVFVLAGLLISCSARSSTGESPAATPTTPPSVIADATATETATATAEPTPLGSGTVEVERIVEHIEELTVEIGPRVAGSAAERVAAEYIADQFESAGYDTEIIPFVFSGNRWPNAQLETSAGMLEAIGLAGTAEGEATGRLVFAGVGTPADFTDIDVEGAVVVVDRGVIAFYDKYREARAGGAVAMIVINNEPGPLVGGSLGIEVDTPVVGVAADEREALLSLASIGAEATVSADGPATESVNVLARASEGACEVLVGGHHDTVPGAPGANDNASGTATVIELARAMSVDGLDDGLCFATFGGEESGLHGSRALAIYLQENSGVPALMFNFDVTAQGGFVGVIGDPELVVQAIGLSTDAGVEAAASSLPPDSGSDHTSFEVAGSRVVFFTSGDFAGIHTPADTFAAVDVEILRDVAVAGLATLRGLYPMFATP